MAENLRTRTTIAQLSRQVEENVHCQPCLYENISVDAVAHCLDCDEHLCIECAKIHRKLSISRNHKVTYISWRSEEVYPGRPWATDIQPDSITLLWNPPTKFRDGDYYQISYKDVSKDRKWKTDESEYTTTSITVTRLKPNTNYIFRVRVVHEDGEEGPYSKESEEIQTLVSQASRLIEISRICLPNDGSPTIHVLPLTEMEFARNVKAKSKRLTLGKPPPGGYVESKTILLVGATGTGKSTFVDGIFNYVLGVTWEDPFRFTTKKTDEEEENENMAESQTEWIKCYTINPEKGSRLNYQLHIIDTPGFGDTRGLERDIEIGNQIRELFCEKAPKGITDIDAVCFLVKAPDARLTALQYYTFHLVMSLFSRDIQDNICSIITFADGKEPPVLAAMFESGLPFGKSFLFNNSCLVAKNDINSETSLSPLFWDMGMKSFVAFFRYLGHIQTKSLQLTYAVLRERMRLQAIFRNLRESLDIALTIVNILNQEKKIIEENKSLIEENKNFEYDVEETQQIKILLPGGNHDTICEDCIFKCHMNCSCNETEAKSMCKVMDSTGFCQVCPGKCHWTEHVSNAYKYEFVAVKVKRTCADMQAKYNEAAGKMLTHKEIVDKNEQKRYELTQNVEEMITLINNCNQRLQEIALRPNPITVTEYVDLLIEEENMSKKDGYLEKIALLKDLRESLDISSRRTSAFRETLSEHSIEAAFQRIALRLRSYIPDYKF